MKKTKYCLEEQLLGLIKKLLYSSNLININNNIKITINI